VLDEGLLIRVPESDGSFSWRFSFDELSDYLLYLVFMRSVGETSTQNIIQNQIQIISEEDLENIYKAEKFLSLIARSLDNLVDLVVV